MKNISNARYPSANRPCCSAVVTHRPDRTTLARHDGGRGKVDGDTGHEGVAQGQANERSYPSSCFSKD